MYLDYEDDLNCTLLAVKEHGAMTLREIAPRLGVSFVRVKQIEDVIMRKMKKKMRDHK
jgi:DNA-directed RNA polymerase sigma subunit (sigma70/sigma32)